MFDAVNALGHWPVNAMAKTPYGSAIGTRAMNPEALFKWAQAGIELDNIYVCLNPSSNLSSAKPSLETITKCSWMMLDFDPHPTLFRGISPSELYKAIMEPECLPKFFGGTLPTHLAIDSGRGLQLWIKLDNDRNYPLNVCGRIVKGITTAIRGHLICDQTIKGYILDDACAELSHLARLPGTINQKTKRVAHILKYHKEEPLSLDAMSIYAAAAPEPPSISALPPTGSKWYHHAVFNGLTIYNRDFIRGGVDTAVESRHKRAYACAKQLFEVGCDADLAAFMLYGAAERCTPNLNHSDPGCIRKLVKEIWKT